MNPSLVCSTAMMLPVLLSLFASSTLLVSASSNLAGRGLRGGSATGKRVDFDWENQVIAPREDREDAVATSSIEGWKLNCMVPTCNDGFPANEVCLYCLRALAVTSTKHTADPYSSGVKRCETQFCGNCNNEDDLRNFYVCGLRLEFPDNDFDEYEEEEQSVTVVPTNATTMAPTPTVATSAPSNALWDTRNCPALFPGSGTACYMYGDFKYKKCMYYEKGPNATCQCSTESLIWTCSGIVTDDSTEQDDGIIETDDEEEEEEELIDTDEIVVIEDYDDDGNNSTTSSIAIVPKVQQVEDKGQVTTVEVEVMKEVVVSVEEGDDEEAVVAVADEGTTPPKNNVATGTTSTIRPADCLNNGMSQKCFTSTRPSISCCTSTVTGMDFNACCSPFFGVNYALSRTDVDGQPADCIVYHDGSDGSGCESLVASVDDNESAVVDVKDDETVMTTDTTDVVITETTTASDPSIVVSVEEEDDVGEGIVNVVVEEATPLICDCDTCTEDVWNAMAGDYKCGERISFLYETDQDVLNNVGITIGPFTGVEACSYVSDQYPDVCGACSCGDGEDNKEDAAETTPHSPPSSTTSTTAAPPVVLCGCEECTEDVWDAAAGEYTCGERITYLKGADETMLKYIGIPNGPFNEIEACRFVSNQYPDTCTCGCENPSQPSDPPSMMIVEEDEVDVVVVTNETATTSISPIAATEEVDAVEEASCPNNVPNSATICMKSDDEPCCYMIQSTTAIVCECSYGIGTKFVCRIGSPEECPAPKEEDASLPSEATGIDAAMFALISDNEPIDNYVYNYVSF